jgi:RNA ligase (TIGR02306 family)
MSTFEVKVVRIDDVTDHPNADRLSLNKIGGFVAVSNKEISHAQGESDPQFVHRYRPGQLVIYVPEGAIVPDSLLQKHGYWDAEKNQGILAGSKGNRVKAIKLRNVVSQGLIFEFGEVQVDDFDALTIPVGEGPDPDWLIAQEGDDIGAVLGITKYEPEIPASMSGDIVYYPSLTLKFDIENQQKYPDVFTDDEYVYATEKLHGTFAAFVCFDKDYANLHNFDINDFIEFADGKYATAYSKGLGYKGFVFKATPENIERNIYLRTLKALLADKLDANDTWAGRAIAQYVEKLAGPITFLGEIYGKGIQDLQYSLDKPKFALFSIHAFGNYIPSNFFFDPGGLVQRSFETVPLLFQGPYKELIDDIEFYRDGKSVIDNTTIREGLVVTPQFEGRDERIGRRALKLVSPDYLVRKGGTEYN